MAMAAIVNAIWDLYAKSENKPLWKLLADMTPREIVSCIDFRYITDALTPQEALSILEKNESTKAEREARLLGDGYPAYTTSVAWLAAALGSKRNAANRLASKASASSKRTLCGMGFSPRLKAAEIRAQGFSGPAMLPMSELEYGGVVEKMGQLDGRFTVRQEEHSAPDGGNSRKRKAA